MFADHQRVPVTSQNTLADPGEGPVCASQVFQEVLTALKLDLGMSGRQVRIVGKGISSLRTSEGSFQGTKLVSIGFLAFRIHPRERGEPSCSRRAPIKHRCAVWRSGHGDRNFSGVQGKLQSLAANLNRIAVL